MDIGIYDHNDIYTAHSNQYFHITLRLTSYKVLSPKFLLLSVSIMLLWYARTSDMPNTRSCEKTRSLQLQNGY
ncbi:hypothetical protein EON63_02960 [archaeon]|nr:MAG: hypothetical protein EON63_02960 [archaeon]